MKWIIIVLLLLVDLLFTLFIVESNNVLWQILLSLILLILLIPITKKSNLNWNWPKKFPWIKATGLVFLTMIFSLGVGIVIAYFFPNMLEEVFPWQLFLYLVVAAPIFEEVLFRGIIIEKFSKKYTLGKALLFSGLLFSLAHVDFLGSLLFALLMGIFYIQTKSLLPPLILHLGNNGLVFLLGFLLPQETEITTLVVGIGITLIVLTLIPLLLFVYKHWPGNKSSY